MGGNKEVRDVTTSGNGPKTVLVSGATGLIGRRLVPHLQELGYSVRGLTRGPSAGDFYHWDPVEGTIDPDALDGVNVVVHLAGENIAAGRWSASQRERILQSRVKGTRLLVAAMRSMECHPEAFVSASGVNIYPEGTLVAEDESIPADSFLGEVCRQWEKEAMQAEELGVRTVCLRTGVVLDPDGGALGKLLPVFRLGLGGPVGTGHQGFPWIAIDDLVAAYAMAVENPHLRGPVNAVHPQFIRQEEFSSQLANVLGKPGWLRLPEVLVKLLFGQMGKEVLLSDLRIQPAKLLGQGFTFRHSTLEEALQTMLG